MKVIHVINSSAGGGAENIVYQWPHVYLEVEAKKYYIYSSSNSKNIFTAIRKLINLGINIRKERITILHTHLSIAFYYGFILKFFLGVKWVHTEHNTINRRQGNYFLKNIDRRLYKMCDLVATISEGCRDHHQSVYGRMNNVVVINNGADHYPMTRQKREAAALRLASLGSLTYQKGFDLMIDIIKSLPCDLISSYDIYGKGLKFAEYSNSIGGDTRIKLMGWTDNLYQTFSGIDILVVPSRWEGFGLVVIEALSAGIPVLASNVPGLSKFASHDDTSVTLFEVGDKGSFLEALRYCKDNLDKDFIKVVTNATKLAQMYSKTVMYNNYHYHYQRIVL